MTGSEITDSVVENFDDDVVCDYQLLVAQVVTMLYAVGDTTAYHAVMGLKQEVADAETIRQALATVAECVGRGLSLNDATSVVNEAIDSNPRLFIIFLKLATINTIAWQHGRLR